MINNSTRMSQEISEAIDVDAIFDAVSSYFKITYDELVDVLHKESNYKRLLKMSEQLFFDAPTECSSNDDHLNTRLCFSKVNLLATEIDEAINTIIQMKLDGKFLDRFKEEVLKAVLDLPLKKKCSTGVKVSPSKPLLEIKKNEPKVVLETIKDLSKYCAQNIFDIKKQVIEMPVDGIESCAVEKTSGTFSSIRFTKDILDIDNYDSDSSNISLPSVSSVHTSDLSSFDDEILLTSDEEAGIKRKSLSLKEIQNQMKEAVAKSLENTKDGKEVKNPEIESNQPETQSNESTTVPLKSQRKRKPNLKYIADDMMSPLEKFFMERILTSSPIKSDVQQNLERPSKCWNSSPVPSMESDVPRKKGKPNNHSTSSVFLAMDSDAIRKRGRPPKNSTSGPILSVKGDVLQNLGTPVKHSTSCVVLSVESDSLQKRPIQNLTSSPASPIKNDDQPKLEASNINLISSPVIPVKDNVLRKEERPLLPLKSSVFLTEGNALRKRGRPRKNSTSGLTLSEEGNGTPLEDSTFSVVHTVEIDIRKRGRPRQSLLSSVPHPVENDVLPKGGETKKSLT